MIQPFTKEVIFRFRIKYQLSCYVLSMKYQNYYSRHQPQNITNSRSHFVT